MLGRLSYAYVHEIMFGGGLEGNKPASTLNKVNYDNLEKIFFEHARYAYTRAQLKNQWDSLKKDWQNWKTLGKQTGLGWSNEKKHMPCHMNGDPILQRVIPRVTNSRMILSCMRMSQTKYLVLLLLLGEMSTYQLDFQQLCNNLKLNNSTMFLDSLRSY